jgi:hypothetical protein
VLRRELTKRALGPSFLACVHCDAHVTPEPEMLDLDAPVS